MELKNNNFIKTDGDLDGELLGKKLLIPNCAKCIHSDMATCKKFNMSKNDLAQKGIDIFACPYFEPKQQDSESISKIKEMGFKG